jgi:magnesium-protoporphyrin IX monomethyl ester (oxidative) cyclase
MDPAASIEFTRGCPWDCSFCSAWTFYGRSYRRLSPEAAAEDMARIGEPGVFIVDDVAFIKPEEGEEIARQLERRKIRKQYYLETRCDVLLRNEEVFRRWQRLGLNYMFLGLEALDEEGLAAFRKRTTPAVNNKALEVARSMGLSVAIKRRPAVRRAPPRSRVPAPASGRKASEGARSQRAVRPCPSAPQICTVTNA